MSIEKEQKQILKKSKIVFVKEDMGHTWNCKPLNEETILSEKYENSLI